MKGEKRQIKPLYLTWQSGISRKELKGVFGGLKTLKGVVKTMGTFHDFHVREKGDCIAEAVEQAKAAAKEHNKANALCANSIRMWQRHNPWQMGEPHYHLMVVKEPLYRRKDETFDACAGVCFPESDVAILTLDGIDHSIYHWALTLHEVGHLFCATPPHRTDAVKSSERYGRHCTNECVMRLGLTVRERAQMSKKPYPYCMACIRYMKQHLLLNGTM